MAVHTDDLAKLLKDQILNFKPGPSQVDVGEVDEIGDGIAVVSGLRGALAGELVEFTKNGVLGIALNLNADSVGIIIMGEYQDIREGDLVRSTGRIASVPVGDALVGRVINAVGQPLDGKGPIETDSYRNVERIAPGVIMRQPVDTPVQTGITAIDALIPIGRGQRELIVGDRQTGKTALALDAIINQRDRDVVCVYVAIGQRKSSVLQVMRTLEDAGAMDHTVIVTASPDDPPALIYLAPYVGTTIAEEFLDRGGDVLIVYDDLTRHADAYRELSLLLRRPPGREAYPGDIFYLHSRLLERAVRLSDALGGGSITALPIVETRRGNISAYVPTNLISITDGQVYLSPDLFQRGQLPAVDEGRSVSRVGGKTQLKAYRSVAGDLRLSYSLFEELETFSRIGTRLDEKTKKILAKGERVREVLKQSQFEPMSACEQVAILVAVTNGAFTDIALDEIEDIEREIRSIVKIRLTEVCSRIEANEDLSKEDRDALTGLAREIVQNRVQGERYAQP